MICPHPIKFPSILPEEAAGLDGEEKEGGAIRADSQGIRIRNGDDQRVSTQAGAASADGAPGPG